MGETVFCVNPMPLCGENVRPVARNFRDFLRLMLATGGAAAMARAALQELGYSPVEISAALKGVDPGASTEEMVRFALRAMVMKG